MEIDKAMLVVNDVTAPIANRIAAAAAIWRFIDEAKDALESIKRELRAEAATSGGPAVTFEGEEGSLCRVLVSPRTLKVRDGVTIDGARAVMGNEFDAVFEARLALRKSISISLESLSENARENIRALVTEVENPSRVSFRGVAADETTKREPARKV